ncbi:MAG TPA: pitrilysin family protein [Gemmatimonadaceae bacterium]|jgi:predicted Zn-dependent peptidase|nr:pitrilysin family protein [Gemmatimonadaceae bacterium]
MKARISAAAVILGLVAATSVGEAQTLDRSKVPALGPPPKVSLPPIVTRQLPNGLKLMVVEQHELPLADFVLVVGSGGTMDPAAKGGVANLTSAMLTEGTTSRSALEIADQVAFLGIGLNAGSSWDAATINLHTPTSQLDSALALFSDVVLHPAFRTEDFDRVKKNRLTALVQLKDRPTAIADQAYAAILYGGSHPYGHNLLGTEASITGMTPADVQSFYRTNFIPNNSTLIVVGDVTADQVEKKISALLGSWQRGNVSSFQFSDAPKAGPTTVYLIDKPGAAQSSFRIGAIGVPRSTKDYFALSVMNTILGGTFTSRLMQNLRETHGYTYGARSRFDMRRSAGPFTASAEVVAAKTDSGLVEFMKELNAIRDTVPMVELNKAKRFLQLSMPSDFETTQQIANQLIPVVLYGLPLDYYNNYVGNIESITQADVQRVAKQYINPASLAIVIVGDRKNIEPGLKAVNAGPITIRDFFGQPISP